jgi:hypothetical protein
VIYVIDGGKVKETNYNPEIGISSLVEQWVTRAAARQRRGRAGRTRPGTCYKLYTRKQEEKMKSFPVPEILRTPLESISLTVKVMRQNEDVKVGSSCLCISRLSSRKTVTALLEESDRSSRSLGYGQGMVCPGRTRGCRSGGQAHVLGPPYGKHGAVGRWNPSHLRRSRCFLWIYDLER